MANPSGLEQIAAMSSEEFYCSRIDVASLLAAAVPPSVVPTVVMAGVDVFESLTDWGAHGPHNGIDVPALSRRNAQRRLSPLPVVAKRGAYLCIADHTSFSEDEETRRCSTARCGVAAFADAAQLRLTRHMEALSAHLLTLHLPSITSERQNLLHLGGFEGAVRGACHLRCLSLSGGLIDAAADGNKTLRIVAAAITIEELSLAGTRIDKEGLSHVACLPFLEQLNLAGSTTTADIIAGLLTAAPAADRLPVAAAVSAALVPPGAPSPLRALSVSGCRMLGPRTIGVVAQLPNIEQLAVSKCGRLRKEDDIFPIGQMAKLRALEIVGYFSEHSPVTPAACSAIANATALTTVNVSTCSKVDAAALEAFARLPHLTHLAVNACPALLSAIPWYSGAQGETDDDKRRLEHRLVEAVRGLESLTALEISNRNMGEELVQRIRAARPTLVELTACWDTYRGE